MKTAKRMLAALLCLCMVLGILPALCLASAADEAESNESVNLALDSKISKADGVDVTSDLANGLVDNEPGGDYWSAYGYDCIEDPIANDSGAWFSVDLGEVCLVDSVKVIERIASGDEILDYYTQWEVYGSKELSTPLTEWVKLGEKKTEDKVCPEGYMTEFEATEVRYLRIYGTKTTSTVSDYFQLCEIEVWGKKIPANPIINLAPNSVISKADGVNVTADLANGLVDNEPGGDYWSAYGYDCIEDPIANDSGAWFSVDLGDVYSISMVKVIERIASGDEILDYYTKWEVYGSKELSTPLTEWVKLGEKKTEDKVRAEGYTTEFDPTEIRYLRIYGTETTSTVSDFFQLCEIEVWGSAPVAEGPENIMRNGKATVRKSDRDVTYELTNGITDIDYYDDYWSTYGTPSENSVAEEHSWFEVNLGGIYAVDAVTVIERLTDGSNNLLDYYTNWEAYATQDATKPISEWTKIGEKKNEDKVNVEGYTVTLEEPVIAQYLRIYCTKTTSEASTKFQVCEIEVWGVEVKPENIMANGTATVRKSDRDVTYELTNGITDIDYYDDYWSAYGTPSEDSVANEDSWFEMNLGGIYAVDSVTVIERLTDGSNNLLDYYTNWELYASLDGATWTKVGEKKNEEKVNVEGYTVEFEAPVVTQYLRVYCTKTTSEASTKFQLTELEAWGIPSDAPAPEKPTAPTGPNVQIPDGAVNRAQGEGVVISKADGVDVTKDLANGLVDTDAGGDYWSAYGYSCILNPIENGSGAWFSVDLGAVYTIDAINVIGRMGDYFHHWEVYGTGDEDAALEGWVKLGEKTTDELISRYGHIVEFDAPTEIRYLRIYGTKTTSTMSTYFQLCEIEVWDYNPTDYTAPEAPEEEPGLGNTITFPPAEAGDELDPDENKTSEEETQPDTDPTPADPTPAEDEGDDTLVVIAVVAIIAVIVICAGVALSMKKKRS